MADEAPSAQIGLQLTHRRVFQVAAPIVLSNTTIPILGAVDTGVVGQLGLAAPIGAVGIGAIILTSIYWIFGFLRMGTTGLVAQAHGAGDRAESGAILMRALIIAGGAGGAFILGQALVIAGAFTLAPTSDEVEALARDYLSIRIWGAPATIALYAVSGWLIAVERTRGVLWLQLWINGLNIGLDLWFVIGLGLGVEGVALATLVAEWTGLAWGLWLCRGAFSERKWRDRKRIFDAARLRRMGRVNGDIMLRSVLLQASFTSFLFIGAGFGDVTLAANQVLFQFLSIASYIIDGFAFSAETFVGQAVGRRSRAAVRRSAALTSVWGVGTALALTLTFWLAGGWIIDLMAAAPEVRQAARAYQPWIVVAPLVGIASYMFDGIFIGATRTRAMRVVMMQAAAIYALALWVLTPMFGNHGLWGALMVLNVARGVLMAAQYRALERDVT
jgi:MATE family multidrug resistance protein